MYVQNVGVTLLQPENTLISMYIKDRKLAYVHELKAIAISSDMKTAGSWLSK